MTNKKNELAKINEMTGPDSNGEVVDIVISGRSDRHSQRAQRLLDRLDLAKAKLESAKLDRLLKETEAAVEAKIEETEHEISVLEEIDILESENAAKKSRIERLQKYR